VRAGRAQVGQGVVATVGDRDDMRRALEAIDAFPPRLDTHYLIPARPGGVFDLANLRRRGWAPAIEASEVDKPARIYDLRKTFASNALAAGVSVFELARDHGDERRRESAPTAP
jgi:hypothetical protein